MPVVAKEQRCDQDRRPGADRHPGSSLEAQKRDRRAIGDEAEAEPGRALYTGSIAGRVRHSHVATMSLVTVIAVNMVVTMPIPRVTAKPRTGPEPKA